MIIKDVDEKKNLQKFQEYGHKAEKQMAFYLKRAFQNSKDIFVLNDIRLVMNDDVAQIDHLILHRFGFIIVESKSVTSKISINEHGEWTRHYPKFTRGMPSPVNQAIRQADFLQNCLMARSEVLLRKKKFFQATFKEFKYDVLVAISDNGIINRAANLEINEVHKADQITNSVQKIITGYADTNKKILTLEVNSSFHESTMVKIAQYLQKSHTPRLAAEKMVETKEPDVVVNKPSVEIKKSVVSKNPSAEVKKSVVSKKTTVLQKEPAAKVCGKCSSEDIAVTYGKFGYYFKCLQCDGNTAIKLSCEKSTCKPRIRKAKLNFHQECADCKKTTLYFVNKA